MSCSSRFCLRKRVKTSYLLNLILHILYLTFSSMRTSVLYPISLGKYDYSIICIALGYLNIVFCSILAMSINYCYLIVSVIFVFIVLMLEMCPDISFVES